MGTVSENRCSQRRLHTSLIYRITYRLDREKGVYMNTIIFGSAVTGCYAFGMVKPRDIDVLTDNEEFSTKMVEEWSLKKFGEVLPIDMHKIEKNENGAILVPVLNKDNIGYEVLASDSPICEMIRENGFASILRLYGNNAEEFLAALKNGQYLSLLPPQYSYWDSVQNQDKYYSGLLAFRNAAKHVSDFEILACKTNCGRLLIKLLDADPTNWRCSADIGGNGHGWSHAHNIVVSPDKTCPVLQNEQIKMDEEQTIKFLFS